MAGRWGKIKTTASVPDDNKKDPENNTAVQDEDDDDEHTVDSEATRVKWKKTGAVGKERVYKKKHKVLHCLMTHDLCCEPPVRSS